MATDTDNSGFIDEEISSNNTIVNNRENGNSSNFTNIETIHVGVYNFIAKGMRHGRWWLIKGIKESHKNNLGYVELLRKEFEILISLQHNGIAAGISHETIDELGPCIIMEWIDGITLGKWLQQPHAKKERLRIIHQLIDTLEYIHGKQVSHRDLKPSNIMVTRNGQNVKLIDFGLADTDNYAIYKQPAGTTGYISPEQTRERITDSRNDIYSLGCVIDDMQLGIAFINIIKRCKSDAQSRYQTVGEVRQAINRASRFWLKIGIASVIILAIAAIWIVNINYDTSPIEVPRASKPQSTTDSIPAQTPTLKSVEQRDTPIVNTKTGKPTTPDTKKDINSIIKDGKAEMDKIVAQSGLNANSSLEELNTKMNGLAQELSAFVTTYPQNSCAGHYGEAKAQVSAALLDHYNVVWNPLVARWQERGAELQASATENQTQ